MTTLCFVTFYASSPDSLLRHLTLSFVTQVCDDSMLRHLTIAERRNLDETVETVEARGRRRNLDETVEARGRRRNLDETDETVEARGRLINARRGPMPSCASDIQRATIRGRGTHSRTQTYQVVGGSAKPVQARDPMAVRAAGASAPMTRQACAHPCAPCSASMV